MSRFYEIGRSNQKTFLTKNVGNDEKPKPYFMTSWPKMLNDLITRQFPLKLEHTSYINCDFYMVSFQIYGWNSRYWNGSWLLAARFSRKQPIWRCPHVQVVTLVRTFETYWPCIQVWSLEKYKLDVIFNIISFWTDTQEQWNASKKWKNFAITIGPNTLAPLARPPQANCSLTLWTSNKMETSRPWMESHNFPTFRKDLRSWAKRVLSFHRKSLLKFANFIMTCHL